MWLRNEWFWDGEWIQDANYHCMKNLRQTWSGVVEVIRAWRDHVWVMGDDLIIGIPTQPGLYLVTFHKEDSDA